MRKHVKQIRHFGIRHVVTNKISTKEKCFSVGLKDCTEQFFDIGTVEVLHS